MPRIARDVLEHNPDYPHSIASAVERLARDIEDNGVLPQPAAPAPDVAAWAQAQSPRRGERWLETGWFFAEFAFYRELARICRFWETGRDPFAAAKEAEMTGDRPWSRLAEAVAATSDGTRAQRIATLLEASLWGNRVDLSYTVAAERAHREAADLLVDERDAALPFLLAPDAHVHLVADNAGTELALDVAVVDALLSEPGTRVSVHLKMQPVFVSDALPCDVWRLLRLMRDRGGQLRALADRFEAHFSTRRLELLPDPYWTQPRFLWDLPPHLRTTLGAATLVILKGDANYRRLIGDALWPPAKPFAAACAGFPAPILCARTMKSDAVLGLPEGIAEELDRTRPRWRIDGQRGLLQAYVPG